MTRRTILAATVLLFCGFSSSAAGQVRISAPKFGTARAGEMATTEWIGLPAGVDELELLLSVEGRDVPLRLTARLLPQPGAVLWRVPNILSRRARIRLRFGLGGEEVESVSSAVFEILPSENDPPTAVAFHDGEWWVETSPAERFPGALGPARDGGRVQENREAPPCAGSSRGPAAPARREPFASVSASPQSRPPAVRSNLSRKPTEAPRRI